MYSQLLISYTLRQGTLRVADVLDGEAEEDLQRRIDDAIAAGCLRLDVDCRRVVQAGWGSLAVLSAAKAYLESVGGALRVTRASAAFTRTARAAGLHELVPGLATVAALAPTAPVAEPPDKP
ncbi:STAS domain-containing protein [Nocardioides sp. W7]|uniref:STAS domain-containing protein n=1 Tax=Nocardioides sp. W7 TaxID=2931390 RepID=UPI001FD25A11|nr:STAS domain-containing protein [Nocardioides sp. W7]